MSEVGGGNAEPSPSSRAERFLARERCGTTRRRSRSYSGERENSSWTWREGNGRKQTKTNGQRPAEGNLPGRGVGFIQEACGRGREDSATVVAKLTRLIQSVREDYTKFNDIVAGKNPELVDDHDEDAAVGDRDDDVAVGDRDDDAAGGYFLF
ncbi:hypothetical protein HPP92_021121 [Vanilla planifolia]|uniref:Uncharacterized protein n=1 Tax=Vanilla planifolia TaxID=51239 RepID=A0A835Q1R0_VANPL|nr:hypothetical protein HPP92_021121 [Vanilla planifolia]